MEPLKLLVLGGSGYLGGRLIAYVHEERKGCCTVAGLCASSSTATIKECIPLNWLERTADRERLRALTPFDVLVHLAFPDRKETKDASRRDWESKARKGVRYLVELCSDIGARHFVHVSTVKVYGHQLSGKIDERQVIDPPDTYSALHAAAEEELASCSVTDGIRSLSLRLANSFGRPVTSETRRWDLIVNEMCMTAVRDGVIYLGSGAYTRRDFVPMALVTQEIAQRLDGLTHEKPRERNAGYGQLWRAWNIGTGNAKSLYEMACIVQSRAAEVAGLHVDIQVPPKTATAERDQQQFDGFINSDSDSIEHFRLLQLIEFEIDQLIVLSLEMRRG